MNESIKKLGEGLNILGYGTLEIRTMVDKVRKAKSKAEAELIFHDFKMGVKKNWKRAVFDLHPDRGGDEKEFKKIVDVMDILNSIKIKRPRRRIPRVVIHNWYGTGYYNCDVSTSYAYYWDL
jgi:hypothetical protein